MFFAYDEANENTDTTVTPLTDECADRLPDATPEVLAPAPVSERKPSPIVYVGLGIALVAMGQDLLQQGLDELARTGLRRPRVLP